MKRQMSIMGAASIILVTASAGLASSRTRVEVGIEARYEGLTGYGSWIHHEQYGEVWQPHDVHRHAGWRPYQHGGCWVRSSAGVRWRSYYPWGQVTFGFGRWIQGPRCGWVWAPGPACAPPQIHHHGYPRVSVRHHSTYDSPRYAPPPRCAPRVYHHAPVHVRRAPYRGGASGYRAAPQPAPRHAPAPHTAHPAPRASSRSSRLHAVVRGRFGR